MPLALAFIDSPEQLLVILAILLLIFGPSKLPQLGASMGKTIKAFRESAKEGMAEPASASSAAAQTTTLASQQAAPSADAVACPQCGAPGKSDAQFCTRCGAKIV